MNGIRKNRYLLIVILKYILEPMDNDDDIYNELISTPEIANEDLLPSNINYEIIKIPFVMNTESSDQSSQESPIHISTKKNDSKLRQSSATRILKYSEYSNSPVMKKFNNDSFHKVSISQHYGLNDFRNKPNRAISKMTLYATNKNMEPIESPVKKYKIKAHKGKSVERMLSTNVKLPNIINKEMASKNNRSFIQKQNQVNSFNSHEGRNCYLPSL